MERATDETRWTRGSQRDRHERSPQGGPIRQYESVEQTKQTKKTSSIFAAICVALFALDSAWSVGSFPDVGLGPAPGTPNFTSPASPAQFHVREFFLINWTAVPGAHHYSCWKPTMSRPSRTR